MLFIEGNAATAEELRTAWGLPASLPIGSYSGGGIGLSTDGDAVNLFDAGGNRVFGVTFGASTTGFTFDNAAGATAVTTLSVAGRNGAYTIGGETGSPGAVAPSLIVSEVAPWSSGNSPFGADWIELTNTGAHAVDISGFRIDDSSNVFTSAVALTGVSTLAAGESAIFLEGNAATTAAFKTAWFGANVPAGLQVGFYSGGGIGLSTDGDAVNVFDAAGNSHHERHLRRLDDVLHVRQRGGPDRRDLRAQRGRRQRRVRGRRRDRLAGGDRRAVQGGPGRRAGDRPRAAAALADARRRRPSSTRSSRAWRRTTSRRPPRP